MSKYRERLHAVIPGGAHTYSRGDDQFPGIAPPILERGEGAYVFDPDGNRYLDYGMALRAVTLGYAHPRVNAAAWREIERGVNLTRASVTELRAAETLRELIPSAEMVKFAKNGSNVTTAAIKIARAHTARPLVAVPRQHPFFSFDDWFIGTTPLKRGIPAQHFSTTLVFDYGDAVSLEKLFAEHPGQIAAVMLEPATTAVPCPSECTAPLSHERQCNACPRRQAGFLHKVEAICRRHGALFILDEMITGFRWHLQGAQAYFGVDPDLTTFGKAMANGFSVSAVVGKREFMSVGAIEPAGVERTFLLSTTHGAEMPSLGAFMETVSIYREHDVIGHLWRYGQQLMDGLRSVAADCAIASHFTIDGPAISMNYIARDRDGNVSMPLRTLFMQEMVQRGVLMPWVAVSLAHGDRELDLTLTAAREALRVVAQGLEHGVEKYLTGPAVKPVFRKLN